MALLELCVEDLAGVEEARKNGISRVEICDDLSVGGLTPSLDFVEKSLAVGDVDVMVLVRPRAGDFIHTPAEVEQILHSIREISALPNPTGVQLGFVVGALNEDLTVNEDAAIAFREAAGDKPLTFHRAFDETPDLFKTIDQLKSLGYQRALTTGGNGPKADADSLRALQEYAGDDFTILVSGGLRSHNVAEVLRETGAREAHMRAPRPDGSTDPDEVKKIVEAVRSLD
ncbi:MAG TPA: copper homeostasis protein CutC [Actinomyces sp.]|nr:copper homeostasis protein CutC [Actinomyces sp.]